MLKSNSEFLNLYNPKLLVELSNYNHNDSEPQINVVEAKNGMKTLQSLVDGKQVYIHSKYDPLKEAERILASYEAELNSYDHIFFYGIGLGYHIELLTKKYPKKQYTIYEPSPLIFKNFMDQREILELPLERLKGLFVGNQKDKGYQFLIEFSENIQENVLLVVLPSYERIYNDKYHWFTHAFKETVQRQKMNFAAELAFSMRWTLNSLMNLSSNLTTPNLLKDKRKFFENKPVLIVSAGPSLHEEMDNLKNISKQGLAYIFAVGSANKALLTNDIMPDALCTYDPQEKNFVVYHSLIDEFVDSIPMIYGSSVGYETIKKYKGPKLHVITSQDKITPYYQGEEMDYSLVVDDAYSIAIVTLQMLAKMRANPVILVGQNFSFRDNLFYSKEIPRDDGKSAEVQQSDLMGGFHVSDVHGGKVQTNPSFNQMRLLMEKYIEAYPFLEVINTTKGGAVITGTTFISLQQIINERLNQKVVDKDWFKTTKETIFHNTLKKIIEMEKEMEEFVKLYADIFQVFKKLDNGIEKKKINSLQSLFVKFDKIFNSILQNDFYNIYVSPVTRVHLEILKKNAVKLKEIQESEVKAAKIIQSFGSYLHVCRQVYNELTPIIKGALHPTLKNKDVNRHSKLYTHSCGTFTYSKEWSYKEYTIDKQVEIESEAIFTYHEATSKNATIIFRFKGTSFKIIGAKPNNKSSGIRVTIDGYNDKFTIGGSLLSHEFVSDFHQVLYERKGLKDRLHTIKIELLDDNLFIFNGVEINKDGRLFHLSEVESVKELGIGKRIRCNYKAFFNSPGIFTKIGWESKDFLPIESTPEPDGDFYFICVDDEIEGYKLIADRVIQNYVSWNTLRDSGFGSENGKVLELFNDEGVKIEACLRLLSGGGSSDDKHNEWDQYVVSSNLQGSIIPSDKNVWNWGVRAGTWANANLGNSMKPVRGKIRAYGKWHGIDATRWAPGTTTDVSPHTGFRPVLILK
ncbi:motility associated factor glycosyltransferase family protein [Bacillus sp. AK128]